MSTSITEIFKKELADNNHPCELFLNLGGIDYSTKRRDLNAPLISFLFALHDLMFKTKKMWHDYSNVIMEAVTNYHCKPNDYSQLQYQFNLINMHNGEGMSKYKTLNANGFQFINNNLLVSKWFYNLPPNNVKVFSKERVNAETVINAYLKRKKKNEPFWVDTLYKFKNN